MQSNRIYCYKIWCNNMIHERSVSLVYYLHLFVRELSVFFDALCKQCDNVKITVNVKVFCVIFWLALSVFIFFNYNSLSLLI